MEGLAAHIRSGFAGHPELEKHFTVERAFADKMAAIIGQIDRVVRSHMDAMRSRVLAFAPRAQEIARAIEHHDRVFATVEDVDIVSTVDPNCTDLLERPAVRQLRPILDYPIF